MMCSVRKRENRKEGAIENISEGNEKGVRAPLFHDVLYEKRERN